jgi:predicted ferric reductase
VTAVQQRPTATSLKRRPQPVAEITLTIIGLGAVAVLGLWWQDTLQITTFGGWLTNAGRITGLLAGYAIVVLLALMARIPWLERGVGTDRLARWHAIGGRYTVSLAVAHTLLIIWGYSVTYHSGLIQQTGSFLTTYPDVLMATVALGLFVAVGIVSARAARRRLRYETWHFIHLYTYLAAALAFSHQFSTGADFVANQQARVFWSALYIAVGAALLWYRFLVPIWTNMVHGLRVVEVVSEGPGVVSVYITGRRLDELHAVPGQFFRWRFLTRGLWWAANPYSLSAAPRHDMLRITVKIVGEHSDALRHLRPGTRVVAEGPYGGFTADRRGQRQVLLLGGGVGITPIRALFESLPGSPGEISVIYRTASPDDLVLKSELDAIADQRGARVHYLVGPPRKGPKDHLSSRNLHRLIPDLRNYDVYLCGPPGMATAAKSSLLECGVPRRHIHHESFEF